MLDIHNEDPSKCQHDSIACLDHVKHDLPTNGALKPKFICTQCGTLFFMYRAGSMSFPQTIWGSYTRAAGDRQSSAS